MGFCPCMNWCRENALGDGVLPPSVHHPGCDKYRERMFFKVSARGSGGPWCLCRTADEVRDMIEEDPGEYDVRTVRMTEDQADGLPEFTGF